MGSMTTARQQATPGGSAPFRELADIVMQRADALADWSEEPGAITRAYGTQALRDARDAVQRWMEDAGLRTRTDALGSLIGYLEGAGETPVTFLLGSHIDSVRNAGRYDGPLGVLVAVACAEQLKRSGEQLPFALEIVAFADEEGLRYHAGI